MWEVNFIDLCKNIMKIASSVSANNLYDLTEKDPRKSLYVAVILQALLDLSKPETKDEDSQITLYRDQAHAWFFTCVGVTCEDFETICFYAGLPPIKVRTFAYEVVQSGDVENVRRKFQSLL